MNLRLESLADHDVRGFSCGVPSLDDWLHTHARNATGHGTRTYLLLDDADHVLGYFAVAPHLLLRADAPPAVERGAPQQIPAILLAKLALDSSVHGAGLGSELLVRALEFILDAAQRAGGRVVLVDAADDAAAAFYLHHDFQPLPHHPHRLLMKLSTAARALGHDWP